MLELTIPAENYQDPMRRRRSESEVVDLLVRYEKTDREQVETLINGFVKAKLLVRTGENENAQLEVAHEAIFRNWDKFREWVSGEETKERLQAIRGISREATQWAAQGCVADYLKLKGEPLNKALGYAQEGWLDEASRTYVQYCERAEQLRCKERKRVLEERNRAIEERNRAAQRLRGFAWFAVFLAVIGGSGILLISFYAAAIVTII